MSFNSVVGLALHTATLILLGLGVFAYPPFVFWAGVVSVIDGILLLANTLITKAFIGSILAPVMLISMVLMIILGATLIFPVSAITGLFSNYPMVVLLVYIAIYIFAIIHVATGL